MVANEESRETAFTRNVASASSPVSPRLLVKAQQVKKEYVRLGARYDVALDEAAQSELSATMNKCALVHGAGLYVAAFMEAKNKASLRANLVSLGKQMQAFDLRAADIPAALSTRSEQAIVLKIAIAA